MTQQFSMPDNWDRPTGGSPYGQPPKKKRKWPWIVAAVFALLMIVGLVAPSEEKSDEKPKTVAEASTPAVTSPPKTTSTTTTATTTTTTAAPPTRIVTSVVTSIVEVPVTRGIPETNTATQAPLPVMPRTSTPVYVPVAPDSDAGAVYYENCTAVKAAGAAPIMQGEAGYRSALDRDGDGVACET
ncbi:excalibur calcium-binding domain-containing protein [Williamsia muralis]|nr:excalibur calcium-binding domain-containing protein [Williamsia marianensis]